MMDMLKSLHYARSAARWTRKQYASMRDRRLRFRDLSRIPPHHRRPSSPLLQFYSSNDNIGNYTPVLGIHDMLETVPDAWHIHRPIDFEFINRNYSGIIIGGAGLLHPVFARFWHKVSEEARLPTIIWGVGGCWPPDQKMSEESIEAVRRVGERCDLVNARDVLTADYFGWANATVAPCPTIYWLRRFRSGHRGGLTLLANHDELVPGEEIEQIRRRVVESTANVVITDNVQKPSLGLLDMIQQHYLRADRVVTTRLHGAIIAYGLGIPYIALAWDEKVRAFHSEWSGGRLVDLNGLRDALATTDDTYDRGAAEDAITAFGLRAKQWACSLAKSRGG